MWVAAKVCRQRGLSCDVFYFLFRQTPRTSPVPMMFFDKSPSGYSSIRPCLLKDVGLIVANVEASFAKVIV